MKKTKTKCYLYTRVSTSMQVDGYSLDAQRDKLRKYAEYEDMVVAGEYSDEGFSGKNIQGRHEFQRMLQDIQDGKDGVEYVLVFKLSRFGRNAADVLNSLQLMQDFGVNLICVEDGIDSSKDSGKLMISVLSAVAEIERENIRTQTMAGREQKAREGKWNGGFAPYGYRLEKGELLIAEDEVDVIRTIFDRYIHTNDGVSGVAKYLNRQGFVKKLRQNGTIPGFSASFVKSIIDNPVYMGKIAYGRRRTEKKIGTRNEMHVVEQSEFPVYEGKHEAIISEEDWNLAQEKRKVNAYRREKVNDPTHAHILSGILKCPCCGKSLYGNIAKAHSKDKKTRYYYYCKNTVTPTGHECTFRLNIEQTEMNRMVASIISAMVSDPRFADAIKAKIGSAVDTNDLEKQLEALQAQLRQTLGTKARLERQMDGLDVNDPYYDRKISDLQRRYDEQYGRIDEIEVQIDDVQSQIRSIRQEKISGDNIYRLLLAFDQVYEAASEVERKEFMRAFIERIELFPEKQPDGNWIRKIIFNFPVPVNGTEVTELPLENETTVETVDGMSIQKIDRMIELLREEKYQWKPARREYIPKENGKKRPLGIPTWGDKLLQEVMREILEAYYEPQFSNHSHGFRPNRGCHTALQEIQIWKGTRWFIEGDISKYFDTIDHDVLLKILEKNIHDGRFLRLISNMLKAGYLDDWKFNQTISGAPQGGVISPLLANIYLNEFDQWIENTLIPQYTKGKRQKSNPAYNRMNAEISKARKNRNIQTAHKLEVERRNIPSVDPYDENYRRCRYVRYADDFLIGFTGSKADAEEIKAAMHNFLENELRLELSQEKTLITNASSQAAKFLGYEIKAQRANDYIDPKGRRGANGAIALLVPAKVIESKCQSFKRNGKVTHRNALLQDDDFSIVQQFQAEYRGLVQYYILAQNLSWFSTLYWVMETSLLKTLACKHRSSMKKQKKKYRTTTTSTSGKEVPCLQVVVPRPGKKPLVATWGGIFLVRKRKAIIEDKPYKVYGGRTELVKRLLADTCELCGSKENIEVHHIRKLADVKNKGLLNSPTWAQVMAAGNRKTLVVCRECHVAIHNGTINKPLS